MSRFNSMLAKTVVLVGLCVFAPGLVSAAPPADVTPAQVNAARTAADHEAIAASYDAEASAAEEKAKGHDMMAKAYRGGGSPKSSPLAMVSHCESLASDYRSAAKEYRLLAEEHRKLAAAAGK